MILKMRFNEPNERNDRDMENEELFKYIDHTALKAYTSEEQIGTLCREALEYGMAGVCIPSCYVRYARESFPDLMICTVVGFPLGNANTAAKTAETVQAVADGADEIDMVINVGLVKSGYYDRVEEEIRTVKKAAGDHILKVIIETCYLSDEEKTLLCGCVSRSGADYIKTSTGFGTAGASLDDVRLMRRCLDPNVKIKAAGGIRSREEMEAYIEAGASRIGTSGAIGMLS